MEDNKQEIGKQKGFTVKINGRERNVEHDQLSYEEIVNIAYPDGTQFEQPGFRIVFSGGIARQEEGDLEEGGNLKLQDGMVINVTPYDLS